MRMAPARRRASNPRGLDVDRGSSNDLLFLAGNRSDPLNDPSPSLMGSKLFFSQDSGIHAGRICTNPMDRHEDCHDGLRAVIGSSCPQFNPFAARVQIRQHCTAAADNKSSRWLEATSSRVHRDLSCVLSRRKHWVGWRDSGRDNMDGGSIHH